MFKRPPTLESSAGAFLWAGGNQSPLRRAVAHLVESDRRGPVRRSGGDDWILFRVVTGESFTDRCSFPTTSAPSSLIHAL